MAMLTQLRIALVGFAFLLSLVFIRVYDSHSVFLIFGHNDDPGFILYTDSLLRTGKLDWCDRRLSVTTFCSRATPEDEGFQQYNKYPPGTAITLFPVTLFGWVLYKLGWFTPAKLEPVQFWSTIGAFLAFLMGIFLLFETTRALWKKNAESLVATLAFTTGNIVLYYVFRRPLLAHSVEFLLTSAAFYLFVGFREKWKPEYFGAILGGIVGLLAITRLNDAYLVGVFLALLLWAPSKTLGKKKRIRASFFFIGAAILPICFYLLLNYHQKGSFWISGESYDPWSRKGYFQFQPTNPHRIFDFFMGPHWGIFGMMPILLLETIWIAFQFRALKKWVFQNRFMILAISALLLFQLNMLANYGNNGMSFGYRYLATFMVALHVLFLWAVTKTGWKKAWTFKRWAILAGVCSLLASFHLVNFESNDSTLTLIPHRSFEEGLYDPDWQNQNIIAAPNYIWHSALEVLKGKSFKNLAVSPMIAYPFIATKERLRTTSLGPKLKPLYDYYESPKRRVFRWLDLRQLLQYHLWIGFFCVAIVGWLIHHDTGIRNFFKLRRIYQILR